MSCCWDKILVASPLLCRPETTPAAPIPVSFCFLKTLYLSITHFWLCWVSLAAWARSSCAAGLLPAWLPSRSRGSRAGPVGCGAGAEMPTRGSFPVRDRTCLPALAGGFFTPWSHQGSPPCYFKRKKGLPHRAVATRHPARPAGACLQLFSLSPEWCSRYQTPTQKGRFTPLELAVTPSPGDHRLLSIAVGLPTLHNLHSLERTVPAFLCLAFPFEERFQGSSFRGVGSVPLCE